MEGIFEYLRNNPSLAGLVIAAVGLLLLVGAILNWEWVVDTRGQRRGSRLLRALFGARGEMILASSVILLAGLLFFFLL